MFDLIIIGAGPAGISAAFEAKKHNLSYVVIEKGLLANTVYNYPVGLTVFSTVNELEIIPGQLRPAREKPTREELLSYYVRFVLEHDLNIQTEEIVESVVKSSLPYKGGVTAASADGVVLSPHFEIITNKGKYDAKNVLFAIGAMDRARKLNAKGEDLSKVHDTFRETYPWVKKGRL